MHLSDPTLVSSRGVNQLPNNQAGNRRVMNPIRRTMEVSGAPKDNHISDSEPAKVSSIELTGLPEIVPPESKEGKQIAADFKKATENNRIMEFINESIVSNPSNPIGFNEEETMWFIGLLKQTKPEIIIKLLLNPVDGEVFASQIPGLEHIKSLFDTDSNHSEISDDNLYNLTVDTHKGTTSKKTKEFLLNNIDSKETLLSSIMQNLDNINLSEPEGQVVGNDMSSKHLLDNVQIGETEEDTNNVVNTTNTMSNNTDSEGDIVDTELDPEAKKILEERMDRLHTFMAKPILVSNTPGRITILDYYLRLLRSSRFPLREWTLNYERYMHELPIDFVIESLRSFIQKFGESRLSDYVLRDIITRFSKFTTLRGVSTTDYPNINTSDIEKQFANKSFIPALGRFFMANNSPTMMKQPTKILLMDIVEVTFTVTINGNITKYPRYIRKVHVISDPSEVESFTKRYNQPTGTLFVRFRQLKDEIPDDPSNASFIPPKEHTPKSRYLDKAGADLTVTINGEYDKVHDNALYSPYLLGADLRGANDQDAMIRKLRNSQEQQECIMRSVHQETGQYYNKIRSQFFGGAPITPDSIDQVCRNIPEHVVYEYLPDHVKHTSRPLCMDMYRQQLGNYWKRTFTPGCVMNDRDEFDDNMFPVTVPSNTPLGVYTENLSINGKLCGTITSTPLPTFATPAQVYKMDNNGVPQGIPNIPEYPMELGQSQMPKQPMYQPMMRPQIPQGNHLADNVMSQFNNIMGAPNNRQKHQKQQRPQKQMNATNLPNQYPQGHGQANVKQFTPSNKSAGKSSYTPQSFYSNIIPSDDMLTNEVIMNGSQVLESMLADMSKVHNIIVYGSYSLHLYDPSIKFGDVDISAEDPYGLAMTILILLQSYFGLECVITKIPMIHNYYRIDSHGVKLFDFSGTDSRIANIPGNDVFWRKSGYKIVSPVLSYLNQIIRTNVLGKPEDQKILTKWCNHTWMCLLLTLKHKNLSLDNIKKMKLPKIKTWIQQLNPVVSCLVLEFEKPIINNGSNKTTRIYFVLQRNHFSLLVKKLSNTYVLCRPYGIHNELAMIVKNTKDIIGPNIEQVMEKGTDILICTRSNMNLVLLKEFEKDETYAQADIAKSSNFYGLLRLNKLPPVVVDSTAVKTVTEQKAGDKHDDDFGIHAKHVPRDIDLSKFAQKVDKEFDLKTQISSLGDYFDELQRTGKVPDVDFTKIDEALMLQESLKMKADVEHRMLTQKTEFAVYDNTAAIDWSTLLTLLASVCIHDEINVLHMDLIETLTRLLIEPPPTVPKNQYLVTIKREGSNDRFHYTTGIGRVFYKSIPMNKIRKYAEYINVQSAYQHDQKDPNNQVAYIDN